MNASFMYELLECPQCGQTESFTVMIQRGAGGSGTYFKFTCPVCYEKITMDFDNPEYEG
jgi:DNA-directed RNA polymerase subunit M/transcription elongation factor TFIIS